LAAGADVSALDAKGKSAKDFCAMGSECWMVLESARESSELKMAVGKAGHGVRKAAL
jgi:hypothetical protein